MDEGYTIAYVAEAEVIHKHDETYPQVYKRYKREAIALKQILPDSRFSLLDFIRSYLRDSLSDLNQARHEHVLFKQFLPILRFRLMQAWGTYQGYHFSGNINAQLHRAFYYPSYILNEKKPQPRPVTPIEYEEEN